MEAGYARSSGIWWDQLQINDTYARTLQLYTAAPAVYSLYQKGTKAQA